MRRLEDEHHTETMIYGTIIEFLEPEPLIEAAKEARREGFQRMDAYSPYPVEELPEAIGVEHDAVALWCLVGGILGGILAFGMQWYCNVIDYPINVGGRPMNSWPAFIPVTFELTVLGAALSAAYGMLALNSLPKLWHPAFNAPEFLRASRDRFFLLIEAVDSRYDAAKIQTLMAAFKPVSCREVTYEK